MLPIRWDPILEEDSYGICIQRHWSNSRQAVYIDNGEAVFERAWSFATFSASRIATFAASFIQQLILKITVARVKFANGIRRDLLKHEMRLICLRPSEELESACIVVFSDAGFPQKDTERIVAQEVNIIGV